MTQLLAGIVVVGDTTTVVYAEVPDDIEEPITIIADDNWKLQTGARGPALVVQHQRVINFFQEHTVNLAIVKGSASAQGRASLALLESAEARGVVIAAASSVTKVEILTKARISKSYGDRKVDAYLKDDTFWDGHVTGQKLRKASREAAMLIIASRER